MAEPTLQTPQQNRRAEQKEANEEKNEKMAKAAGRVASMAAARIPVAGQIPGARLVIGKLAKEATKEVLENKEIAIGLLVLLTLPFWILTLPFTLPLLLPVALALAIRSVLKK